MFHSSSLIAIGLLLLLAVGCAQDDLATKTGDLDWPKATQLNKPWTRWWWLGSAVDQKNLTREMEMMDAAGIGGVEVTPLYGATGYENRDIEFLSPKWISMMRHVGDEGKRLDFGVDMATGTGWPFGGGPVVTPELADTKVERRDGKLVGVPTQMKVKRAAPGDEGWVLDPYSVNALRKYLDWFRPLERIPRGLVRGQFHDSFEYQGNWTDELPARFRRMHGYDINNHVNALFGEGDPDTVARVKSDYRHTLSQLHYDYVEYWVKWCHDKGYEARNQAHGAPGNILDLYAVSDVPETETFGSTPFKIPGFRRDASEIASNRDGPSHLVTRFATSAQHVMGREVSSCETLTWLREHFKVALSMAKPELDQMFLTGINHILYHGTCYSPDDAAWPGWQFYASSEINDRDTLWKTLPQMNAYIQRCQSILQAGTPDNDVLLYFPIFDHWDKTEGLEIFFKIHTPVPWLTGTQMEKTAQQLVDNGYAFDMISDKQLIEETSNDGAVLEVPGGKYQVLLVPKTTKMPPETLERIIRLADGGATVLMVDQLPQDVPGLANLQQRRAKFAQLKARLSTTTDLADGVKLAKVGSGRVMVGPADALLKAAKVRREAFTSSDLGFVRRKRSQGNHYFIASQGTRAIDGWVPLSAASQSAVLLDPMTGKTGVAVTRKSATGTEIYLQLRAGESMLVRTFADRKVEGPVWQYFQSSGQPVEITGSWQVTFTDGAPALPAPVTTNQLASWTTLGNEESQRFAGTARYKLMFDRPASVTGPSLLDLGDVREAAVVRINGKQIGTAWALPFVLPIQELQEGINVLEVDVTNLASNRLRDLDRRGVKWRIFKEINYVNINYQPFDASGWPIAPSGLLGPVKLTPIRAITP